MPTWMFDDGVVMGGPKVQSMETFVRDVLVKLRFKIAGIVCSATGFAVIAFLFFSNLLAAGVVFVIMTMFLLMMSLMVNANEPVGKLMEKLSNYPWILWKPTLVEHHSLEHHEVAKYLEHLEATDYLRFTSRLHMFRNPKDAVLFKLSLE